MKYIFLFLCVFSMNLDASARGNGSEEILTEQDIRQGYRWILGREPESQAVIEHHLKHGYWHKLRKVLLESQEFKLKIGLQSQFNEISSSDDYISNPVQTIYNFKMCVDLRDKCVSQKISDCGCWQPNLANLF